ncbi:sigma-70 family RNA polymerase sigma factor [Agrococcus jenensis]|uniref:RNA polymerase sigma factor n=1 Tax=Agrococcus jenensis TaxID=46353 RepID=A0A3N2AWK8_9MICO|nr:sigma-70 family RNA polymerase sigma factor [Agrococcus jenensis]ROR67407.1 RNA polymerase sigma-70 factor (ECF subfamily) [Agrococcus jenensis]
MQPSLERHLELAGTGDVRAFATVFDLTSTRVLGTILRVLLDRAQAEEVAQDVFVEAWRSAGRFDPARGSATSWLLRIAHARAVDRVRATQAQRDRGLLPAARDSAGSEVSVQEQVERSGDAARVREALAQLSDVQREAIVLACFGGMTQTEIAEHQGVPLDTVQAHLRDGMRRLRRASAAPLPGRDPGALSA